MSLGPWALTRFKEAAASTAGLLAVATAAITRVERRPATEAEAATLAEHLGECLGALAPSLEAAHQNSVFVNGMLPMDAAGIDYLSSIGTWGQERAVQLAAESRASSSLWGLGVWYLWLPPGTTDPPRYVLELATALWRDRKQGGEVPLATAPPPASTFAPASEPLLNKPAEKYPVISATVLRRAAGLFFSRTTSVRKVGAEVRLVSHLGETLGRVSPESAGGEGGAEKMLAATRSLLGHRLFRLLVFAGAYLYSGGKLFKDRVRKVEGGLSGLAKALGVAGSKSATQLRSVLDAFQHLQVRLPHGETESLMSWNLAPTSPGAPATLRLVLHDAVLPGYVSGLPKKTAAQREARRLVPIPRLPPPLVAHERTHAAQALLQLLIFEELSAHAEELYETGYVRMPWARWEELARDAGLRYEVLEAVFRRWVYGENPVLCQCPTDGEMFNLSDAYEVERFVITCGGQKSARGRARQARSAKARAG